MSIFDSRLYGHPVQCVNVFFGHCPFVCNRSRSLSMWAIMRNCNTNHHRQGSYKASPGVNWKTAVALPGLWT